MHCTCIFLTSAETLGDGSVKCRIRHVPRLALAKSPQEKVMEDIAQMGNKKGKRNNVAFDAEDGCGVADVILPHENGTKELLLDVVGTCRGLPRISATRYELIFSGYSGEGTRSLP